MKNILRFLHDTPKIVSARRKTDGSRPCIGLAVSDAWPDRYQIRRLPYDLALARAGARILTFSPGSLLYEEDKFRQLNGLVISGGEDVHPSHYEGDIASAGEINLERDRLELRLIEKAICHRIPLLCICRGAQLLAVWAGGKLESHDADELKMKIHTGPLWRFRRHVIALKPGSRLQSVYEKDQINVNSFHHQAIIDAGKLAISGTWEKDMIEGVELPGEAFVVGVQWHPELLALLNSRHQALFSALVEASRTTLKLGGQGPLPPCDEKEEEGAPHLINHIGYPYQELGMELGTRG